MHNKMTDLRNHLFEALEMLKSGQMQVDQARAMSEVGKTIIDTAKLELQYREHVDERQDSGFFDKDEPTIGRRSA